MKFPGYTAATNIWRPFSVLADAPAPMRALKGKGIMLEMEDGRKIMDCISSWWVTIHGHGHPVIAEAIYEQALTLEQVIFADCTHQPAEFLAEKLLSFLPGSLSKVFYSDNGSCSVEIALKLASQYWHNLGETQRNTIISFEGAYHGDTIGAMSVGADSVFNKPFKNWMFDVKRVPFPATYCGDDQVEERERECINALRQALEEGGNSIAAVIIEPLVQGAGGMRMCRPEFLRELQGLTKDYGVLQIYDECFTGIGRTGDWFACRKAHTNPDIVCLSKGITGGFLPLAATICSDEIYRAFYSSDPEKTFWHGHSYTANPLGCAAGIASFELLQRNPFPFTSMEEKHLERMGKLACINGVKNPRVCGTIAAFDLDLGDNEGYLNPIAQRLKKRFLDEGLLIRPLGNTVYLVPPYCVTDEQLEFIYDTISKVITEL